MTEAFAFPLLSAAQARAVSTLAGKGRTVATTFEGEEWTIRFRSKGTSVPAAREVVLLMSGAPALLQFSPTPGGNWHHRLESAPALEKIPEPYRAALQAALCEEILNSFEKATGLTATLAKAKPSFAGAEQVTLFWEARNGHKQKEAEGVLRVDPAILDLLLKNSESWPTARLEDWVDPIDLVLPVILESFPIAQEDFAAASPGDIWLLEISTDGGTATGIVLFPGARKDCRILGLEPRSLPAASTQPESPESTNLSDMNTPTTKHWTDDLNVELAFQVGTLNLKMEELRSLDEGHIFELSAPPNELVTVLVNGKPAGRGELVQVGDRLGVLLTAKTSAE